MSSNRYEMNHSLDHLFVAKTLTMKQKPKKNNQCEDSDEEDNDVDVENLDDNGEREIDRPAAICCDIKELVYKVMLERNLTPDSSVVKLGADDGQGIFKITVQVLSKESTDKEVTKRMKYSQVTISI